MKLAAVILSVGFAYMVCEAHAEPGHSFGYDSVAEALQAIRADPSAEVYTQQGWTLATQEKAGRTIFWAFTPTSHPAYPAAVKRTPVKKNDGWHIEMAMLCGSEKRICDQLWEDFKALNERMRQDIERRNRSGQ